jgi:hypothetical protein
VENSIIEESFDLEYEVENYNNGTTGDYLF